MKDNEQEEGMEEAETLELTHVEIAGTLAALRVVMDSAPHGVPGPLASAAAKLDAALTRIPPS